ncbi:MAG: BolA family transcriptional regulator [Gammaproteobacteria bacterium]|nr:BolA family transcriptional regulator [Gammaproteobacteria bacterium]MYF02702.1 BolA family transcriptional regulator [Gammaproteobacteria bacterium]MYI77011.1 BolA family transcriptional regulator [Gammaproteobacteria bacterium]
MELSDELKTRLRQQFADAQISVQVQGTSALLGVVSSDFEGRSQVQRQQLVYSLIGDLIQTGELHAVTIQAKAPSEIDGRI